MKLPSFGSLRQIDCRCRLIDIHMAYKPGIDVAVHWMEKKKQYRFRFLLYRGGLIYCWYWYIGKALSLELRKTREPYRTIEITLLYLYWPLRKIGQGIRSIPIPQSIRTIDYVLFKKDYSTSATTGCLIIVLLICGGLAFLMFLLPFVIFFPSLQ